MRIDPALKHQPTFEEVLNLIVTDKSRIKLPDRTYVHFFDSPLHAAMLEAEKDNDDHEDRRQDHIRELHELRKMAATHGVTPQEMRQRRDDDVPMHPPPQPPQAWWSTYSTQGGRGHHLPGGWGWADGRDCK